jgi:2-polyprenyl-6-methoxyphenol hydroxylase-like FAD-dependent oxidoreductase
VEWFIYFSGEEIMYLNKVRKIIIFGGGTSGWLTAAFMSKNLAVPAEIVLIEDSKLGPIGVGEGTQPFTAKFLSACGIPPKMWMKPSSASFKYGVELVGWNDEPYFVDNDNPNNTVLADDFYTSDYFIDKPYKEFSDWHPAYRLAKKNVCQKFDDYLDVNHQMGPLDFGAVHFSAYEIIATIKKLILDRITYVDTKIVDIKKDQDGIKSLVGEDDIEHQADLYIDCSGFNSLLLEKTLGVPFSSFGEHLLCDKAVVIPTQYKDPEKECHPYTKATAMNSGWMFTIPIFTRIGNGYVYSSKHISKDDAEQELRKQVGEYVAPARHLDMKCGYHKEIAYKNVCAVGLSAGFVEPLEATGITFTTGVVSALANSLNASGNVWGSNAKHAINRDFNEMSQEIFTFVWAHYHFSTKNDTPFWQEVRSQKLDDMPDYVKFILSHYLPVPKRFLMLSQTSMFNIIQWFSMLHAGGAYKDIQSALTDKQKSYAEYFIKSNNARLDIAEEMFLNQYQYLKQWYRDE